MKKSELKNILKPLIRECIKEVILDEGILSGVISEVARGVALSGIGPSQEPIVEERDPDIDRIKRNAFSKEQTSKLKAQKKKLMEAVGAQAYNGVNLFEGTTAAPSAVSPAQQAGALSGLEAGDPGVDINNLFGAVGRNWGAHMDKVKEDRE